MACSCRKPAEKAADYFMGFPCQKNLKKRVFHPLYKSHPLATRAALILPCTLYGVVNTFLFMVKTIVGCIALPLFALYKYACCRQERVHGDWLKATSFCILGTAAVAGFVFLAAFEFSFLTTLALLFTGISISIVIHVYRGMLAPR